MPTRQRQATTTQAPRIARFDTDVFGEGVAVAADEQPRGRTSQAHGRHAANAVIAATSSTRPARAN